MLSFVLKCENGCFFFLNNIQQYIVIEIATDAT